jgi:hypothetical protein
MNCSVNEKIIIFDNHCLPENKRLFSIILKTQSQKPIINVPLEK